MPICKSRALSGDTLLGKCRRKGREGPNVRNSGRVRSPNVKGRWGSEILVPQLHSYVTPGKWAKREGSRTDRGGGRKVNGEAFSIRGLKRR